MTKRLAFTGLLTAASILLVAAAVPAQPTTSRVSPKADMEALQAAFVELADAMRPSIVAIRAERRVRGSPGGRDVGGAQSRPTRLVPSIGSGVIIREDGKILTNEHVIQEAEKVVVVLHDGSSHEAIAIHADPRSDLAVVQIDAEDLQPAPLSDLSRVRQGHWAFAMGNPFGLGADGGMVMSHGIVTAIGRKLQLDPTEARYYGNLIQTSAAVNPGNSGGPLVNLDGEIIGITTAISTRTGANEGVGFAVPMEARTKAIIDRLLRGEPIEYGYLGVMATTPSEAQPPRAFASPVCGAIIDRLDPGSPADKARLAIGDVIVEFDGSVVEDADHLVRLVGAAPIGRVVSLTYSRQGRRVATFVMLTTRPRPSGTKPTQLTWRGMTLADQTEAVRDRFRVPAGVAGLVITAVAPKSPADHAGIKPGRVLQRVGDVEIGTAERLGEILPGLRKTATIALAGEDPVELAPE